MAMVEGAEPEVPWGGRGWSRDGQQLKIINAPRLCAKLSDQ